jgi:orotate phosphoribosyltransferase
VGASDSPLTPDEARELLEGSGAVSSGHFRLTSGRHSDLYVQKARVLEQPARAMRLAREIASWYPTVDVVVAPAAGAIALGFAVAMLADARSIFAERTEDGMQLRRGFRIEPGERVLVVEDVVTTGGSAREVYDLAKQQGGDVLGVAALVDRTSEDVGFPLRSVLRIAAISWSPEQCPLCRRGIPVDTPGSHQLPRG